MLCLKVFLFIMLLLIPMPPPRLNPVTSALSNPVQMEVLNSGSERIGRIVKERVPLFKSRSINQWRLHKSSRPRVSDPV